LGCNPSFPNCVLEFSQKLMLEFRHTLLNPNIQTHGKMQLPSFDFSLFFSFHDTLSSALELARFGFVFLLLFSSAFHCQQKAGNLPLVQKQKANAEITASLHHNCITSPQPQLVVQSQTGSTAQDDVNALLPSENTQTPTARLPQHTHLRPRSHS